jgi:hypothetical protein
VLKNALVELYSNCLGEIPRGSSERAVVKQGEERTPSRDRLEEHAPEDAPILLSLKDIQLRNVDENECPFTFNKS